MTLEEIMVLANEEPQKTKPKKYKAIAYVERCRRGAIDGIDSDDDTAILEFVWTSCQAGFTCEIINNETGERKYAYPEYFNENTIGVEELIRDVRI